MALYQLDYKNVPKARKIAENVDLTEVNPRVLYTPSSLEVPSFKFICPKNDFRVKGVRSRE